MEGERVELVPLVSALGNVCSFLSFRRQVGNLGYLGSSEGGFWWALGPIGRYTHDVYRSFTNSCFLSSYLQDSPNHTESWWGTESRTLNNILNSASCIFAILFPESCVSGFWEVPTWLFQKQQLCELLGFLTLEYILSSSHRLLFLGTMGFSVPPSPKFLQSRGMNSQNFLSLKKGRLKKPLPASPVTPPWI